MNYSLTNSDTIPVPAFNAATYAQEAHERRQRLLAGPPKPKVNVAAIIKERDDALEELAEAKAKIAQLERFGIEMEARAGDYCRTLMHYIHQHEQADSAMGIMHQDRRTVARIIRHVLKDHPDISFDDVIGPKRTRPIVAARFAAIWAVKQERPDLTYPAIGKIFQRDHSTILHAVRVMEGRQAA